MTELAHDWVPRLLLASVQGAALALVVLALRGAVGLRLAPRWWTLAWVLVLVRFALVASPAAGISVFNLWPQQWGTSVTTLAASNGPDTRSTDPASGLAIDPGARIAPQAPIRADAPAASSSNIAARPPTRRDSWWTVLALVWAAGAVTLVGIIIWAHATLWRSWTGHGGARLITDVRVLQVLDRAREQHGVRTLLHAAESPRAKTPMVFGFIRPVVIFPQGMAQSLGDDELRGVMLHEVAHVRRMDIPVAWFASLVLALHWFNPLAWVVVWRLRRDRELAADALVLEVIDPPARRAYARTLVSVLERVCRPMPAPALAAVVEGPVEMQGRLAMIQKFKMPRRSHAWFALAMMGLLAGVTLTNARPPQNEPKPIAAPGIDWTDAPAILRAVADRYREFTTYQDTGTVRTTYIHDGAVSQITTQPFETAFAKPDLVRFEFRNDERPNASPYLVWNDGTGFRSWWRLRDAVRVANSAGDAFAGPTGVSGGSVRVVLPLLLPMGGATAVGVRDPRVEGIEMIDGHACVKISGRALTAESPVAVWVDRASLLVRRFEERDHHSIESQRQTRELAKQALGERADVPGFGKLSAFDAHTVIELRPRVNEPIDRRVFSVVLPVR